MIQKCSTTTVSKKRFSEFELVNPSTASEAEGLYLAGYMEDSEGKKKNVKMHALSFLNVKMGDMVGEVHPGDSTNAYSVLTDTYNGLTAHVLCVNYQSAIDFLQVNKISDDMWTIIEGREYLCIKLSTNYPIGGVFRMYFPNFPFNKGVALFPKSSASLNEDEPVEVFYCTQDTEEESNNLFDFYVTMLQLADPTTIDSSEILQKTKIINVMNIEDFDMK